MSRPPIDRSGPHGHGRRDGASGGDADQDWADALAGRAPAGPRADALARLEADSLRQALRRWPSQAPAMPADMASAAAAPPTAGHPAEPPALARLLAEARQGGPVAPACAACAALRATWARLRAALLGTTPGQRPGRPSGAGLRMGAGLALAGVLGLALLPRWLAPPADTPTLRQGTQPLQRSVADPHASREALASRLSAAGADVQRYERAGRLGLDAEFHRPPDADLRAWLADQGLALAPDGSLRVEFRAATP